MTEFRKGAGMTEFRYTPQPERAGCYYGGSQSEYVSSLHGDFFVEPDGGVNPQIRIEAPNGEMFFRFEPEELLDLARRLIDAANAIRPSLLLEEAA